MLSELLAPGQRALQPVSTMMTNALYYLEVLGCAVITGAHACCHVISLPRTGGGWMRQPQWLSSVLAIWLCPCEVTTLVTCTGRLKVHLIGRYATQQAAQGSAG